MKFNRLNPIFLVVLVLAIVLALAWAAGLWNPNARPAWMDPSAPLLLGAIFQTDYAKLIRMMPSAQGGEMLTMRAEFTLTAAATNDTWEMMPIPEDHILVDLILDCDDVDTNGSPTIALSVGYMTNAKTGLDVTTAVNGDATAFIVSSTVGQASGAVRPTTKSLWRALPRAATPSGTTPTGAQLRSLGILATTGSATFAAGKLGLTAIYRAGAFSQ